MEKNGEVNSSGKSLIVDQDDSNKAVLQHLWDVVCGSLESHLREHHELKSRISSEIERDLGIAKCEVVIDKNNVFRFGDKDIDLSNQDLMRKLFQVFSTNPRGRVGRDELIRLVYGRNVADSSPRRKSSDYHNVVKLVSRARKIAQTKLDVPESSKWDWFPFDSVSNEWIFYRSRIIIN
jgi:hypothetical protein